MARQDILVVDGDLRSLRVMEVSLRKAGFLVTTALDGDEALQKIRINTPHLIISDTELPKVNGFELLKQLKAAPATAVIPFIFLTSEKSIDHKIKGLELGVEDYLTKPIYIKEIIIRIGILLNRKEREKVEQNVTSGFIGSLADIGIVDVIQTAEMNRKSGILTCQGPQGRGLIYFKDGSVIDADLGKLRGERAVYRLLLWNEGTFRMSFEDVDRPKTIQGHNQALIMEGMRRMDEWIRIMEQLPKPETRLDVNAEVLSEKLTEIPDEVNRVLKLIDGQRSLIEVVDDSTEDEMKTLDVIAKLYFEGIIYDALKGPAAPRIPLLPEIKGRRDAPAPKESDWAASVFAEVPEPAQVVTGDRMAVPDHAIVESGPAPAAIPPPDTAAAPPPSGPQDGQAGMPEEKVIVSPAAQESPPAEDTAVPFTPPPTTSTEIDIPRASRAEKRESSPDNEPAGDAAVPAEGDRPLEELAEEQHLNAMLKHTSPYVRGAMMGKRSRRAERGEGGSKVAWIIVAAVVLAAAAGAFAFKDKIFGGGTATATLKPVAVPPQPPQPPQPEPPKPQPPAPSPAQAEPVKAQEPQRPAEPARPAGPAVKEPVKVKEAQAEPAKPAEPAASYDELLAKGRELRIGGKNAAALKELRKAVAANAKGAEAYSLIGQILIEMDKAVEAAKNLRTATALNPGDAGSFFFLGSAYQIQGDVEKAKKAYEKYLFLKPTGEFAKDIRNILKDLK